MARGKVDKTEISRYDTDGVDLKKYIGLGRAFNNKDFKKQYPQFASTMLEYVRVRQEIINKLKTHFEHSHWVDFDDFYNSNKIYLIPLGEISWRDLPELKPLEYHIECQANIKDGKRFISFVVDRRMFTKYVEQMRQLPFDKINLPYSENPHANYGRDNNLYRRIQIAVDGRRFDSIQTPLIDKFNIWCDTNKVSKQVGIGKAIELLFNKYPLDKPLEREPDFFDLLPPISMKDIVQKDGVCQQKIELPTMVYARLRDIFSNYNRSPENGNKPKLELSNFFLMATKYFLDNNKQWTLRYGNPDLYDKLKKQAEQAKKDMERAESN